MPATGPSAPLDDVFLYAGSGSGIHAIDCAFDKGPDTIVSSHAYPRNYDSRRRIWWIVERRWFQVQGTELVRTDHPTEKKPCDSSASRNASKSSMTVGPS